MPYQIIDSTQIDIDSPADTVLFGEIVNNLDFLRTKTYREMDFFGDGSDGAILYSAPNTINAGVYFTTNFTINAGVTITGVKVGASGALWIFCTGTFTMAGTLNLSGLGSAGGVHTGGGGPTPGQTTFAEYGATGGGGGSPIGVVDPSTNGGASLNKPGGVGAGLVPGVGGAGSSNSAGARLYLRGAIGGAAGLCGTGGGAGESGPGGAGGGSLIVVARNINFVSGSVVTTTGAAGATVLGSGSGGGGGGGQIWIAETFIADAGTRNTAGGAGGSAGTASGGAGGSGTVLLVTTTV